MWCADVVHGLPYCAGAVPDDPCEKWAAENAANQAVAEAIQESKVEFDPNDTELTSKGKNTLAKVAEILNQYPWVKIDIESHSSAAAGAVCDKLTTGRAENTEFELRKMEVTNPMGKPTGHCGKKRAIVIANPNGNSATPPECVAPADPCEKWAKQNVANQIMAEALTEEISFCGGCIEISDKGKTTLNKVATILNQYPWMTIDVQAHSDASVGARCTELTNGRALSTEKHLKSKGVKNTMSTPPGECGKKKAIVIKNPDGNKPVPAGCDGPKVVEKAKAVTGRGTCKKGEKGIFKQEDCKGGKCCDQTGRDRYGKSYRERCES